ncbi:MAG: chalcone isomerase family protein [Desulfobacterales bacterium]|jgi:hypothetical protein
MRATKFWTILTFAILCSTLAGVSRVETAEIEGINFDDRYTIADTSLKLRGAGLLRVMVFAKIYVAALYLPEDYPSKMSLSDVPKRLEVEYLRSIAGKDFGPATNKKVSENVDPQIFEQLQPRLEYHNSLYQDVRAGDRYALTYIPGKGTELTLNGEPKGTAEGADFAAALFSIWLGPKPISESLKKELLDLS